MAEREDSLKRESRNAARLKEATEACGTQHDIEMDAMKLELENQRDQLLKMSRTKVKIASKHEKELRREREFNETLRLSVKDIRSERDAASKECDGLRAARDADAIRSKSLESKLVSPVNRSRALELESVVAEAMYDAMKHN